MSGNTTEYSRRYREANRERLRASDLAYRQANRETLRAYSRAYGQADPERAAIRHREWFGALRTAVFGHYGKSCACCGATERLSIDHVDGDGAEHRDGLFGHRPRWNGRTASTASFYRWLVANDFPPGFQTLCRRCNLSKSRGGACQIRHQEVRH